MNDSKERITVRLTQNQMLVLTELTQTLNTNISLLVRTIVGSWITQYQDTLYRIIDGTQSFNKDWNKNGTFNNAETENFEDDK